jgi:hypothetical protein
MEEFNAVLEIYILFSIIWTQNGYTFQSSYSQMVLITGTHYTNIPFSATGLSAGVLSPQDLIAKQCPVFQY